MNSSPSAQRHRVIQPARIGLTLIDTVVVISILAVIGAIALPRYSISLANYRAAAAANRVLADLALAQNIAKITSAGQTITFTSAASSYSFSTYLGPINPATTVYTVNLTGDPYHATLASASFNSTTQLTYDRFGQPSSGGTIVLQVGTVTKTVAVDANTGKARLQ